MNDLILKQISSILDTQCAGCEIRINLDKVNGKVYSRTDNYCNKVCPQGKRLQMLGKQLGR